MKRYVSLFLVVLVLLAAAGCGKKDAQNVQLQPVGLWRAEDGSCLGIFENGRMVAFDEETMKQGTWSEENGSVEAAFADCIVLDQYTAEESSLTYTHDGKGKLQAEGKTYAPVSDAEAFRSTAARVDTYAQFGATVWMSQTEMNMGYGVAYELWNGLEQLLFDCVMDTVQDPEVWQEDEDAWRQMRQEEMEAAYAEFEGGTVASMMAATCGISLTLDRVSNMIPVLESQ